MRGLTGGFHLDNSIDDLMERHGDILEHYPFPDNLIRTLSSDGTYEDFLSFMDWLSSMASVIDNLNFKLVGNVGSYFTFNSYDEFYVNLYLDPIHGYRCVFDWKPGIGFRRYFAMSAIMYSSCIYKVHNPFKSGVQ